MKYFLYKLYLKLILNNLQQYSKCYNSFWTLFVTSNNSILTKKIIKIFIFYDFLLAYWHYGFQLIIVKTLKLQLLMNFFLIYKKNLSFF